MLWDKEAPIGSSDDAPLKLVNGSGSPLRVVAIAPA
jgi:hypothetical protein